MVSIPQRGFPVHVFLSIQFAGLGGPVVLRWYPGVVGIFEVGSSGLLCQLLWVVVWANKLALWSGLV